MSLEVKINGETIKTVTDFVFGGSKITEDGDCSHEIKRHLLLGRKATTNLVQFSRSVVSNFLRPHELQHTKPPCPSTTPGVYSNSCPLCRWWHLMHEMPTISFSVVPFSFNLSQHQGVCNESALRIRLPKYWSFSFNIRATNESQDWSPLGWTGWISLQSKGLSRIFSNTTLQKHQFFGTQFSL